MKFTLENRITKALQERQLSYNILREGSNRDVLPGILAELLPSVICSRGILS